MDDTYAEVGTEVVICFYRPPIDPTFQIYHRKRTTIIEVRHSQVSCRFSQCRVAADRGQNWWSISNMILASDIDLLLPEQKALIQDHNGKNNPLL